MKIKKYIIIGLALIVFSIGYYFLDHQSNIKDNPVVISKDKVLLSDQNTYELDMVLNSIISNQIVLQNSIKLLDERIISLEDKIKLMEEQYDNNQSE